MAATHLSPFPQAIPDPVTYKEAVGLLKRTSHEVPQSTLRRWVKEDGLATEMADGKVYVSWSDLLEAHAKRTAAKLRSALP
jgi:hypothetical protein